MPPRRRTKRRSNSHEPDGSLNNQRRENQIANTNSKIMETIQCKRTTTLVAMFGGVCFFTSCASNSEKEYRFTEAERAKRLYPREDYRSF